MIAADRAFNPCVLNKDNSLLMLNIFWKAVLMVSVRDIIDINTKQSVIIPHIVVCFVKIKNSFKEKAPANGKIWLMRPSIPLVTLCDQRA